MLAALDRSEGRAQPSLCVRQCTMLSLFLVVVSQVRRWCSEVRANLSLPTRSARLSRKRGAMRSLLDVEAVQLLR